MQYKIKAIKTYYRGILFRSRLEATWAAFFDLIGMEWEYEPFDMDGWLPDFRLFQSGHKGEILVEVKPWFFRDKKELEELKKKIRGAYHGEVLVLGNSPCLTDLKRCENSAIGMFVSEGGEFEKFWSCSDFDYACLNIVNGRPDISAWEGSYQFRISLEGDGDHHLNLASGFWIEDKWNQAKNKTQWKKRWKK